MAEATQERRLLGVGSTAWFGCDRHPCLAHSRVPAPFYQTSAEDHGRKAVGECQKIRASLPLKCHGRKPVGIYWSTSSAKMRSVGGNVIPSACAVLRLRTSSNFVGCSMGKSPGVAPLRILST